jgi:hypothetical protein
MPYTAVSANSTWNSTQSRDLSFATGLSAPILRSKIATRKFPFPAAGSRNVADRFSLNVHMSAGMRSSVAWTSRSAVNTSPRSRTRCRLRTWLSGCRHAGPDAAGLLFGGTNGRIGGPRQ